MKTVVTVFVALSVLCCVSNSFAVPPAHKGPFGNPEEPALRIVKWPVLGLRKFVVRTHEGLQSGLQEESLCATGKEGSRGAFEGSKIMVDHTARGLVYAPLPPKAPLRKKVTYEEQAMAYIESVTAASGEKAEEPVGESAGAEHEEECAGEKKEPKYLNFEMKETDVEKAQRRYVPERVAPRDRVRSGGGNLLRLAR